jgi:ubiquinone/menaquinone biosynthesis C-methylase UbiE
MASLASDAQPSTTGRIVHWAGRYDWLVWLLTHGQEGAFRDRLLAFAGLAVGEHVLDVGCGTGSLAIAAKRQVGASGAVDGVDASPEMIARAQAKARKRRVAVSFQLAVAEALPFPDARFDVVLATLMLHHLPRPARQRCVAEMRRVLKPSGRVLVVDFAESRERSGILNHVHRHGRVDPLEVKAVLTSAGFRVAASGAVNFSSLQYVLGVGPGESSGH